jgi:hypothetical protein
VTLATSFIPAKAGIAAIMARNLQAAPASAGVTKQGCAACDITR